MIKIRFTLCFLLFFTLNEVYALNTNASYDFVYNNIRYKITNYQEKKVELVSLDPSYSGINLDIPQTVHYEGFSFTVTTLGRQCCSSSALQSVTIPATVLSIDEYAFSNCKDLSFVSIQEGVLTLGKFVFQGCSSLAKISLPNSIKELGYECFRGTALSSFTCPDSLRTIGGWCFCNCKSLTNVTFNDSLNVISDMAFYDCPLAELNLPIGLRSIGVNTFQYAKFKHVTIPKNVTVVQGFQHCEELEELVFPDSVIEITNINHCFKLNKLDLKHCKYLNKIGPSAFTYAAFTELEFPDTVYTWTYDYSRWGDIIPNTRRKVESKMAISNSAFAYLNLEKLVITHAVSNLSGAFKETTIKDIYVKQEEPMNITDESTFTAKTYLTGVLHVPLGKKEAYSSAKVWKNFTTIIDDIILIYPKYTLSYMVDGAEYKSYEIEYGSKIIPETAPTKEGYIFSGWSEIPQTMPAEDVTVTGTFTKGSYKLTYMLDEAIYKTVSYDYGTAITPEAAPTKEGYTFSGWSNIPQTMPAQDVTVTGTFTINKYKLVYMVDGAEYKSYEIEYGSKITPETAPTKEGYTFSGWTEIPQTMPAKDVTVTGTFTKGSYKLTYMLDGAIYKTVSYDYGAAITPEAAPMKEGYTFSGWSNIPKTMPAQDVTVTGTFTVNKYRLTYYVDGVAYKSYEIEYGATIVPEAEPTKRNFTFSGWSDVPKTMPAHDVTVSGSFEHQYDNGDVMSVINKIMFGIWDDDDLALYDLNHDGELNIGDLIIMKRMVLYGTNRSAKFVEEYLPSGFALLSAGYSGSIDASHITMRPGETKTLNISLSNTINGIYGVQFDINLPQGFTLEMRHNNTIYEMSPHQADDMTCIDMDLGNGVHRFLVYSSTLQELKGGDLMSFNLRADRTQMLGYYSVPVSNFALSDLDGNVTKEGGFSVSIKVTDYFTLSYKVDGEDYKSSVVEYGDNIYPEAEPTKEGYTFSGWSEIPTTMPAEDVIVTGTFTVKQYILTYVVDGTVYKEYCYDYGSSIVPEAEPTKEGYTFSGWSEIPETMPANEVYVVGTFTINKYKITYMIDGEVYRTEEVEYGAEIQTPTPETHDGFDFEWSDVPTTMPANDIVIYGTYTSTGIKAILANETDVKIFTVSGKPLNKLQKGVNIIRTRDGKTKKIVVK